MMPISSHVSDGENARSAIVQDSAAGQRLDLTLAGIFSLHSRSRLQQWIREGRVLVDGGPCTPRQRVNGGEQVTITPPQPVESGVAAQPMALKVVYMDDFLLVVDKPAGLVVHPAAGNPDGTLLNGLLHLDPALEGLPRAGIVHRLDKETSGLLVVARTLTAHTSLVRQLQERTVSRRYSAVVNGTLSGGGVIDQPIGRHPVDRKRMAVVAGGRPAVSHYRIERRFAAHTWVEVRLETGRTHQIRVHFAHLRHPLVGDPVYGGRPRFPPDCSDLLRTRLEGFRRQALHATRLGLLHPQSGEEMVWRSPLPDDLAGLIAALEKG